jgi:hypothetical protein
MPLFVHPETVILNSITPRFVKAIQRKNRRKFRGFSGEKPVAGRKVFSGEKPVTSRKSQVTSLKAKKDSVPGQQLC